MSIQMMLVKWMLKSQGQIMGPDFKVKKLREKTRELSHLLPAEKSVNYTTEILSGHETDVAIPENPSEETIIVHIHGGGFVSGSAKSSRPFTSLVAKIANMNVFSLDYRLAPEHPFPAGVEDCFRQYKALAENYPDKKIVLIGESAGGTLVTAIALMARDQGIRTPVCVVANAPGVDYTQAVERPDKNDTDLILSHQAIKKLGKLYCPGEARNPYASPRFADYQDFPPLRIVWDSGEHLEYDCRIFAEKAQGAGVTVEVKEHHGTFHVFQILGKFLPEARQDIRETVSFINKHL